MDNLNKPYWSSIESRLISMGLSSFADTIICKDGFKISIQAGAIFESTPRNNIGPWSHFRVEIEPDTVEPELIIYAGYGTDWEVYPNVFFNVPKEAVRRVITNHGGVKKVEINKKYNPNTKVFSLKTFQLIAEVFDIETAYLRAAMFQKTGLRWGE